MKPKRVTIDGVTYESRWREWHNTKPSTCFQCDIYKSGEPYGLIDLPPCQYCDNDKQKPVGNYCTDMLDKNLEVWFVKVNK